MAGPGRALADGAERLLLAALGVVALTGERIEELVDAIAGRSGLGREESARLVGDVVDGWRRETARLGERASEQGARWLRDLGLATREELEELELRVAQLEHRLRLLERG
jgi:polyhydroxyalkanoate synthesis regulator phasin